MRDLNSWRELVQKTCKTMYHLVQGEQIIGLSAGKKGGSIVLDLPVRIGRTRSQLSPNHFQSVLVPYDYVERGFELRKAHILASSPVPPELQEAYADVLFKVYSQEESEEELQTPEDGRIVEQPETSEETVGEGLEETDPLIILP